MQTHPQTCPHPQAPVVNTDQRPARCHGLWSPRLKRQDTALRTPGGWTSKELASSSPDPPKSNDCPLQPSGAGGLPSTANCSPSTRDSQSHGHGVPSSATPSQTPAAPGLGKVAPGPHLFPVTSEEESRAGMGRREVVRFIPSEFFFTKIDVCDLILFFMFRLVCKRGAETCS